MSRPPERSLDADTIDLLLRDTEPYLSCDACFEQIDAYVERLVTDPGHRDRPMQVHLGGCGACAEEADSLAELLADDRVEDPPGS